jgi:hypothetical protein
MSRTIRLVLPNKGVADALEAAVAVALGCYFKRVGPNKFVLAPLPSHIRKRRT